MRLIKYKVAAVMAASTLSYAISATAADNTPFPRRAGIMFSGPFQEYGDQVYRNALSRYDQVLLNIYPGLAPQGQTMESVMANIKSLNPGEKIFLYLKEDNVGTQAAVGDALNEFRTKIEAEKWYLYTSGTSGAPVASSFGSEYPAINTTLNVHADAQGKQSVDWMTDYWLSKFDNPASSTPAGFFMDDVFWRTRVGGDWDLDSQGHTEPSHDPTSASLLRKGWSHYIAYMRAQRPNMLQIANIADWGLIAGQGTADTADLTDLEGKFDGGVMEGMIGKDYSYENTSWTAMMLAYRKMMAALTGPKMGIFNQWGEPSDTQGFRYGFTSTLMDNAYYSFTDNTSKYHGVYWFDEFDANLGAATSSPPTAAWQAGVYRRDFENGIALVNPKGNTARTVTLETSFVKLGPACTGNIQKDHFIHDATVNNGATVNSVTLQDRDGIILLRSAPQTFGKTTVGSTPSSGMSVDFKRGSKYTLSGAGSLTNFMVYLDGNGTTTLNQTESVRVVLYQDASGVPGAKVAESVPIDIVSTTPACWYRFQPTAPSVALTAGSYWIVLQTGGIAGVVRNMGDGTATQNWYGNADNYADGASDPFGTGSVGTGTISAYVTYQTAAKKFGNATIGTVPSSGLSADFKRGSKYVLSETGTLRNFSVYLDGGGTGTGTQNLRVALYQDAGGVPGTKVAESDSVGITAGRAPGWVTFSAPPVALTAGSYWIVIHTGANAAVARDYGDGATTSNWYGNADTYSDGASAPFGTGSVGTGNLSIVVNYVH